MKTAKQFMDEMPSSMRPSEAMEIFAKQEAIEFGKWACRECYVFSQDIGKWHDLDDPLFPMVNEKTVYYTDEQLYKKYKDENNK